MNRPRRGEPGDQAGLEGKGQIKRTELSKWLDYIRKLSWGKYGSAPGTKKFRVGGGTCQMYTVTDRDTGLLGWPSTL